MAANESQVPVFLSNCVSAETPLCIRVVFLFSWVEQCLGWHLVLKLMEQQRRSLKIAELRHTGLEKQLFLFCVLQDKHLVELVELLKAE